MKTLEPFRFTESGKIANNIEDLLDISRLYPTEAIQYLKKGDFENWLTYIGETQTAKEVATVRELPLSETEKLEKFLENLTKTPPVTIVETPTESKTVETPTPITTPETPTESKTVETPTPITTPETPTESKTVETPTPIATPETPTESKTVETPTPIATPETPAKSRTILPEWLINLFSKGKRTSK